MNRQQQDDNQQQSNNNLGLGIQNDPIIYQDNRKFYQQINHFVTNNNNSGRQQDENNEEKNQEKFNCIFCLEILSGHAIPIITVVLQFQLYGSKTAAYLWISSCGTFFFSIVFAFCLKCRTSKYLFFISIIFLFISTILGISACVIASINPILYDYYNNNNVSTQYRVYNQNRLLSKETDYNDCIYLFNNVSQQEYEQQYSQKCDEILGLNQKGSSVGSNSFDYNYEDCLILHDNLTYSDYQKYYSQQCDTILGQKQSQNQQSIQQYNNCLQQYNYDYQDYVQRYSSYCDPILGIDSSLSYNYETCFKLFLSYSYQIYVQKYGLTCNQILNMFSNSTNITIYNYDNSNLCSDQGPYDISTKYCYFWQYMITIINCILQLIQLGISIYRVIKYDKQLKQINEQSKVGQQKLSLPVEQNQPLPQNIQ